MRHALGSLYADGHDVDWHALYRDGHRAVVLPTYPWQHERYWVETTPSRPSHHGRRVHPLLGWEHGIADTGAAPRVWENELEARDLAAYRPELGPGGDRRVPAAALLDLLLAAARTVRQPSIADVRIDEPMALADEPVTVQTVLDPDRGTLAVFSAGAEGWTRHARARLGPPPPPDVATDLSGAVPVDGPLLDACLSAASANGSLRAVGAAGVHLHREPSPGLRCVVTTASGDGAIADVRVVDVDGRTVATVTALRQQPVARVAERADGWTYRIEWLPQTMTAPSRPVAGSWLVLSDASGVGDALAAALTAGGARVRVVPPGAGHDHVLASGVDELGVVYLRGLDAPSIAGAVAADIEGAEGDACGGLLGVVAALGRSGRRARIHVVTNGAQPVRDAPAVLQAPLCGLARSLAEEMPDLWARSIDLDPTASRAAAVDALVRELTATDDENEVAYRGDERLVARLVRQPLAPSASLRLRPDASYLVTGGFGGLGREVARWLVDQGARRLVLMGRTVLPPRSAWAGLAPDGPEGSRVALIRELERAGAAVHVASLDVGDEGALRTYLERYEAEGYPPIRSVVHTAAVFERRLLGDLDPAELWSQLRPKVVGAWLLSELLGELDHFVLFSSIAAVLPQPGQGAYVAGNAFLDALAHWRVSRGQAALSVNWGIWAGAAGGLLGDEWRRTIAQMEAQGFRDFRADQGLDAMGRMLHQPAPQLVFTPVDWEQYGATRVASALVADLVAAPGSEGPQPARPASLREQLEAAAAEDRLDVAETTVRQVAARVLRLPEGQIDVRQPLGELGLDSLMGIELRNRLEAEVGTKLSATLAWNHPAVADLAAYLLGELGYTDEAPAIDEPANGGETTSFAELLATTDELGDDEIIEALMRGAQR
jgi:acyl transferase domain-containing protein/acyl carrier protein